MGANERKYKREKDLVDDFIKHLPDFIKQFNILPYKKMFREKFINPDFIDSNPPSWLVRMKRPPMVDLLLTHESKDFTLFEFKNKTSINEISHGIGQLIVYEHCILRFYPDYRVKKILVAPDIPDILLDVDHINNFHICILRWEDGKTK